MPHKTHVIRIGEDDRGAVLVVVLVVLIMTIITGIFLMRGTIVESRIAANELESQKDFYVCEAAGEMAIEKFDEILSANILDEDHKELTISDKVNGTDPVNGAEVKIEYLKSTNPPVSSGTSPASSFANYYVITATVNGKSIQKGVWKAFPKSE